MFAQPGDSFYEQVGGHETFVRLVRAFYEGVAGDEPLRALYPEEDLGPAEVRLRMFLEQYFGGPHTYSEQRGHPRLRMRHQPFTIGPLARDAWLRCMHTAIASIDVPIAVTAFTGVALERAGALDITDLTSLAPNVTLEVSRGTRSARACHSPSASRPRSTARWRA